MVVLMSRDMASMHPNSIRFWGVMSLATVTGFAVAYPINLWLVGVRLKHGMGTSLALGKGGTAPLHVGHGAPTDPSAAGATRAQKLAMAGISLIALWAGVVIATSAGDVTMKSGAGRGAAAAHPTH